MIEEIKEFVYANSNENKKYSTQSSIWLENIDTCLETCFNVSINENTHVQFYPFKDELTKICNEDELYNLFRQLDINPDLISLFNIEIIDTKKWGRKPLFKQGIKSICFEVIIKKISNCYYAFFFNKSGTKAIESIYVNGIWKINSINQ